MDKSKEIADIQFFALLRLALTGKEERLLTEETINWKKLFGLAQAHALTGLCFAGIEQLPPTQRPSRELLLPWYGLVERIKAQNRLVHQRSVELVKDFSDHGFDAVILKGCGVGRLYDAALKTESSVNTSSSDRRLELLRMSGDIDIWVIHQKRQDILRYLQTKARVGHILYHTADYHIFSNIPVEVHFTPSWFWNPWRNWRFRRFCRLYADACAGHRVKMGEDGWVNVPVNEFNKVFILQHIYRHVFGEGIGLRQLVDYYFVLASQPEKDEPDSSDKAYQIICQLGMKRFCAAVMWILQNVLGLEKSCLLCPPDEKEGRLLLNEIMVAGNFGQSDIRNRHEIGETAFGRWWRNIKRNARFVKSYGGEVMFIPLWKVWHFVWRKKFE